MLDGPFSPWPSYTEEEVAAVASVLRSNRVNYWTGDLCRQFEVKFAEYVGTRHAVAVANGTLALELALRALGVGQGDEVVTTPRTFVASASCVVTVGAVPVFADVDKDSQNITAETIRRVLTPKTKAIICVHLGGMPCDMDPIMALASERGIKVIEDCAQAHGARYRDRSVGSIGDIGAWSFCQDKIMTTGGEGGMVTTNDPALWADMWSYKDHGKTQEAVYERDHPPGPRLVHDRFGSNWRMLEMQAAIGLLQLEKLETWIEQRSRNANALADACMPHGVVRVPQVPNHIRHAYYRFYAFVEPVKLAKGWNRDRIIDEVAKLGVTCLHGSQAEIYLERSFQDAGLAPKQRLRNAQLLGECGIAMLVHPTMTQYEISESCAALKRVLAAAGR